VTAEPKLCRQVIVPATSFSSAFEHFPFCVRTNSTPPVQYMLQIWSKYVPTTQFTQTLPILEPILSLAGHRSSWRSYELELRMRKPTRQPSPRQACTKPQRVQLHQLSNRFRIDTSLLIFLQDVARLPGKPNLQKKRLNYYGP
jgi:hypothetical protein